MVNYTQLIMSIFDRAWIPPTEITDENLVCEVRIVIHRTGKVELTSQIAQIGDKQVIHEAVPAEDQMQAFLWRHLVPAQKLLALVFDPAYQPPPKRVPPTPTEPAVAAQTAKATDTKTAAAAPAAPKPKFTQQQVVSRLRDLKRLYAAGFLTDEFYLVKAAECQVSQ